jgi:hypothetical protein
MINGSSGFKPRQYDDLVRRIEPFPRPEALDALAAVGVTHVTVNCALYDDGDYCAALLKEAEASPRLQRLESTVWEGAPVALFRLRK